MIRSLLYLTASRSNIMFTVCLCARYQSCARYQYCVFTVCLCARYHFRYLKDTPNLGLWYPKDSSFILHAYSDADFGGCKLDRKSIYGRKYAYIMVFKETT